MAVTDVRFDEATREVIQSLCGKELMSFECDDAAFGPFGVNAVETIAFHVGDACFEIRNLMEAHDRMGSHCDVAVLHFGRCEKFRSALAKTRAVKTPIEERIRSIKVVEETQQILNKNTIVDEIHLVRGIVFTLGDGSELAIEKDVWFSKNLILTRGRNLISEFRSTERFEEEVTENNKRLDARCTRTEVLFK